MVLVVGSMNLDRIARVHRAPGPGETVPIDTVALAAGGKGGNVAAAAARLGARVCMVARVGADTDGEVLRTALADAGVDVDAVQATADAPTGTALIWVDAEGENRIGVLAGANATLSPSVIDALAAPQDLFARAGRIVLNLEIPLASVRHALARAHGAGVPTIVNLSPIAPLSLAHLGTGDTVVVNAAEAGQLLDEAPPTDLAAAVRCAAALCRRGPGTAVVTLGAGGVAASAPDGEHRLAAVPVEPVDTTGAGDAFLGALAAGLDAGLDLGAALRVAAAAGAFTATRQGAQAAQPTRPQLERWARHRGLALPAWGDGRAGAASPAGDAAPRPRAGRGRRAGR